ncbi:MAG TPA: hypothetical protein VF719_02655, partial [Abditibacteriaceae bacterium]
LADDLKNGRVTQRQKMHYYLADTLFFLSTFYINGLVATKPNIFVMLNIVLGLYGDGWRGFAVL